MLPKFDHILPVEILESRPCPLTFELWIQPGKRNNVGRVERLSNSHVEGYSGSCRVFCITCRAGVGCSSPLGYVNERFCTPLARLDPLKLWSNVRLMHIHREWNPVKTQTMRSHYCQKQSSSSSLLWELSHSPSVLYGDEDEDGVRLSSSSHWEGFCWGFPNALSGTKVIVDSRFGISTSPIRRRDWGGYGTEIPSATEAGVDEDLLKNACYHTGHRRVPPPLF